MAVQSDPRSLALSKDIYQPGALEGPLGAPTVATNALTRVGGGRPGVQGGRPAPRRVVVDIREFMSSLPSVLHHCDLELVPATLEVGDYVLSPEVVVERKAVPDLIQSLGSGRLYHQCVAMQRHYKTPVLLIEFDQDRAFALQSQADLGEDIDSSNVLSRLSLLLLHFPRLRLVWSRSQHATAEVFKSLKANQDEPDPLVAAAVGVPEDLQAAQGEGEEQGPGGARLDPVFNQTAVDLLQRLPGKRNAAAILCRGEEVPRSSGGTCRCDRDQLPRPDE